MDEKNTFIISDDEGNKLECEMLMIFEAEDGKNSYIIYTDKTKDENGNLRIYAGKTDHGIAKEGFDKELELNDIKTDEEWEFIESVIAQVMQNS